MKENIVEKKIMWGDMDPLGIVFYPKYYEWIDACGHLFLEAVDIHPVKLWHERKLMFGLAETSCRYFRPGRYHQKIRIATHIQSLEEKVLVLKHSIHDLQTGELMVEGLERRVCMDVSNPDEFHAVPIPEDIFAVLSMAGDK